jgi:hypothetical protein
MRMSFKPLIGIGFLITSSFLTSAAPGKTTDTYFAEDFSNLQYCDTLNTTALWDTAAGVLTPPPLEMVWVGSWHTSGRTAGVLVIEPYAYVVDWDSGLSVVDISDPTNPFAVGNCDTPGIANRVAVNGNTAYVADGPDGGLRVIDITDPTAPTQVGAYDTPGTAIDVAAAGNYAYLADGRIGGADGGLLVFDVTAPSNPTLVGSRQRRESQVSTKCVTLDGDHAFIACTFWMDVLDVSNPFDPHYVGGYHHPGYSYDVSIAGDIGYVATYTAGVQVIDVSIPYSPNHLGTFETPGLAYAVVGSGDYVFVGTTNPGRLQVMGIGDGSQPALVGSFAAGDHVYDVAWSGDFAYLAARTAGLEIVRVFDSGADPSELTAQSTTIPGPGYIERVKLLSSHSGPIEFEFSADGGANWQQIWNEFWHVLPHPGNSPMWRAKLHYLQGGDYPTCKSLTIEMGAGPVAVVVQNFVAHEVESGIELNWDVETDEEIEGFRIYRRSESRSADVVISGAGLIAAELRSYVDNDVFGEPATYQYTLGVVKADGTEIRSRSVAATTGPHRYALFQNFPNPFNPATTIEFALPHRADVRLAIYSPSGRLIRVLVDEPMDLGRKRVRWDGRDETGRAVASGVYFYRLEAAGFDRANKMILLR